MSDLTEDVPGLARAVARHSPGSVVTVEALAPARARVYSEAVRVTLATGRFVVLAARRDGPTLVSTGGVPYREHALYTAPWRVALEVAADVEREEVLGVPRFVYAPGDLAVAERLVDVLPTDYLERLGGAGEPRDPFYAVHHYIALWQVAPGVGPGTGFAVVPELLRELESSVPIEWVARRVRGSR